MQDFLAGVVEGFYGQTWHHHQRLSLFDRLVQWGLNTYFYSPKDDLKHRAAWRESYTEGEFQQLTELVQACQDRGLNFIYGLSPGLDICFSSTEERDVIRRRFTQMMQAGVQHFALLFDDLPGKMSEADQTSFGSVAAAQASVANELFAWLRGKDSASRLLFCPTPYCDRMVRWKLGGEDYLDVIGETLTSDVDVLWTGPEIISPDISAASLAPITKRLQRQPIIWDNLHANDYDMRRLYCGPYQRSADLRSSVRGILSNPNNEFPINYIPLRTLGEFVHQEDYEPRQAFLAAARDWAAMYDTIHGAIHVDDVILLADCYYLPYAHGPTADHLRQTIQVLLHDTPDTWGDCLQKFQTHHRRIVGLLEQLTQLKDRELFYAWSRRIWELREEMDLIHDFSLAKQSGQLSPEGFLSETHLLGTCRGGFVPELQRQLVMKNGRFSVLER